MEKFIEALERTPLDHPDMVVLRARAVEELRRLTTRRGRKIC